MSGTVVSSAGVIHTSPWVAREFHIALYRQGEIDDYELVRVLYNMGFRGGWLSAKSVPPEEMFR